jgi:hypothetical protein
MFLKNSTFRIQVRGIEQFKESGSARYGNTLRNISRDVVEISEPFRELDVRLIGQTGFTKYKDAIFIGTANNLISDFTRNGLGEVDAANFSTEGRMKRNKFNGHFSPGWYFDVYDFKVVLATCGNLYRELVDSVAGKPTDPSS